QPGSHQPNPPTRSPTRPKRQVPYTPRGRPPRLCAAFGRRERAGRLPLGSWDFGGFCLGGSKFTTMERFVDRFLVLGNAGVSCCPGGGFVRFS
ncbi:hypothetical protein PVAP13_1KG472505, partial [Panicum virgatum]